VVVASIAGNMTAAAGRVNPPQGYAGAPNTNVAPIAACGATTT
jgi:hypothetical protein